MSTPSIAKAALTAIESILPEVRALYQQAGDTGMMSFEIIIGELSGLEALAEARVDASTYASHRRALEACHVHADVPEARRG